MLMHHSCIVVLALAVALTLISGVSGTGCEPKHGCRIQHGQCICGSGCSSDYVYANKDECRSALKGRRGDVCQRSPCLNGGTCSQTVQAPNFRCRCEGTGYYGNRCQNSCPKAGSYSSENSFPFECIVI